MSTPLLAEAPEDETQGGDLQSSMHTPQVLPSIQPVAKEEEESSVEGDAQSNKGGVKEENDMPDPWTAIQHMLDKLCCSHIPKDPMLLIALDHALNLIHD
jgi:hypothetical protein